MEFGVVFFVFVEVGVIFFLYFEVGRVGHCFGEVGKWKCFGSFGWGIGLGEMETNC